MTAVTTSQYQVLQADGETGIDDTSSVHFWQICASNLNNYHCYVGNSPIVMINRVADGSSVTDVISKATDTSDNLILYLGRHWTNPDYKYLHLWMTGRRTTGTGTCTFTLRGTSNLYVGDTVWDSTKALDAVSCEIEFGADIWYRKYTAMYLPKPGTGGYSYLYLTAENSDVATRACVISISAQPSRAP